MEFLALLVALIVLGIVLRTKSDLSAAKSELKRLQQEVDDLEKKFKEK